MERERDNERMDKEVFRIIELQLPRVLPVNGRALPNSETLYGEEMTCWPQGWWHMLLEMAFILRNEWLKGFWKDRVSANVTLLFHLFSTLFEGLIRAGFSHQSSDPGEGQTLPQKTESCLWPSPFLTVLLSLTQNTGKLRGREKLTVSGKALSNLVKGRLLLRSWCYVCHTHVWSFPAMIAAWQRTAAAGSRQRCLWR